MSFVIRPETPADIAAIHDVTAAAFRNAPHAHHTEQFIVEGLRKAGALAISLVAEDRGVVVGHVAVSPVSISDGSSSWFGLGPLSVSPGLQGRGIGSLLMQAALQRLRERGAAGCVVLGDPAYYSRFGFKPDAGLVLPDVPPEYFLALPLGRSLPRGVVTYHAAFTRASEQTATTHAMGNKQAAVAFMQLASAGRVDEAYASYVAPGFRHHNPWFAAGVDALKKGMDDNARDNPQKSFEVKRVIEEGDLVVVHSHVRMKPDHPGYALIHICRFEQGRIAELWDVGMEIPADVVNSDGVF